MEIITNNTPRDIKFGYQMPDKFRSEFDYLDDEEFEGHSFFEYKKQWYDLSEFMRIENNNNKILEGWHGYRADSYFSGVVVKFTEDSDSVIIGRYYS